jgi:biopolymer transport protein ExbD
MIVRVIKNLFGPVMTVVAIWLAAAPLASADPGPAITIEVHADGKLVLSGKSYASPADLKKALPPVTGGRVILQVDESVQYGKIVAIMDVLREAGYTEISFAVQHADKK